MAAVAAGVVADAGDAVGFMQPASTHGRLRTLATRSVSRSLHALACRGVTSPHFSEFQDPFTCQDLFLVGDRRIESPNEGRRLQGRHGSHMCAFPRGQSNHKKRKKGRQHRPCHRRHRRRAPPSPAPELSTWCERASGQHPPPSPWRRSARRRPRRRSPPCLPWTGDTAPAPRHWPETLSVSPPERVCRRCRRAASGPPPPTISSAATSRAPPAKPLPRSYQPRRRPGRAREPARAQEPRPAMDGVRRRGRYLIWTLIVRCFAPPAHLRYRTTTRMLNQFTAQPPPRPRKLPSS